MRIVLFCENKYAVDILLPIYQEAVKSETNHILWYVHLPKIPVFPLDGKVVYTYSMQEVYDLSFLPHSHEKPVSSHPANNREQYCPAQI